MDSAIVLQILFWTGVVISLLFKAPPVKKWYEAKTGAFKTFFMLGVNVVVGFGILGVACLGVGGIEVSTTCDIKGFGEIVVALGTIIGGNQVTYLIPAGLRKL